MRGTTHRLPQGPHGVQKNKNAEIILGHPTRPVVLFSHQIYDLLRVGLCTCTELGLSTAIIFLWFTFK